MAVGAEPDILDFLVSRRVLYMEGHLNVLASYCEDPSLLEDLSGSLLSLWKFKPFTDSRWMTVGRACRAITAGFLTGLGQLGDDIIKDPSESSYFISGFRRLVDPVAQEFVVVASLTSWVLDDAFEILISDSRL